MPPPIPPHRWYHLTPDRFVAGLLLVQVLLFLSERFQWFAFNEEKGWTVLIAVATVCVAVVALLVSFAATLFVRRRFQFSFGSLLLFMVVLSVPLGWFAIEMQRARRQQQAVAATLGAGGSVSYDDNLDETKWTDAAATVVSLVLPPLPRDDFFCDITEVQLSYTDFTDAGLAHLKEPTSLERLYLRRTQVTDAGLAHLKGLTNLEWLYLDGTQVTDAGLEHLKGLTSLERLDLDDTQVTDAGLVHLKGLTSLEMLNLYDTQVTDAGLEHLKGLTSLEHLWLSDTRVTDAGLEYLTGLKNLYWIDLKGTQVTDEGVNRFQQALPNCKIVR